MAAWASVMQSSVHRCTSSSCLTLVATWSLHYCETKARHFFYWKQANSYWTLSSSFQWQQCKLLRSYSPKSMDLYLCTCTGQDLSPFLKTGADQRHVVELCGGTTATANGFWHTGQASLGAARGRKLWLLWTTKCFPEEQNFILPLERHLQI